MVHLIVSLLCCFSVSALRLAVDSEVLPSEPPNKISFSFPKAYQSGLNQSSKATILMIGDSTMGTQYDVAKHYFANKGMQVLFWQTAGGREAYPSYWTAERLLKKYGVPENLQAVYLNFGGLHLLHVHPMVPWWWTDGNVSDMKALEKDYPDWVPGQFGWTGDYKGFIELEQWMHKDIAKYKEVAKTVVVGTVNYVCEDKYEGKWYSWTHDKKEDSMLPCASYMKAQEQKYEFWPKNHDVDSQCRAGQMSSDGSGRLQQRMLQVAKEENVPVVDAFDITKQKCRQTSDGRHYSPSLNQRMIDELAANI